MIKITGLRTDATYTSQRQPNNQYSIMVIIQTEYYIKHCKPTPQKKTFIHSLHTSNRIRVKYSVNINPNCMLKQQVYNASHNVDSIQRFTLHTQKPNLPQFENNL